MANTNVAFGLKPIGVVGTAPNSTGLTEYRIASITLTRFIRALRSFPLPLALLTLWAGLTAVL